MTGHAVDFAAPFAAVDRFLASAPAARALQTAFRLGVVGRLGNAASLPEEALADLLPAAPGRRLLLGLLEASGVLHRSAEKWVLAPAFRDALVFEDLMRARLDFLDEVGADILAHFDDLVGDLGAFMAKSRVFDLFRYDRCLDTRPENLDAARRWVPLTTALTRYEAPALVAALDLTGVSRALDIGGNSGELALALCRAAPDLHATVVDLPAVCALGREHVSARDGGARIRFVPADMRRDQLPGGMDLVVLKSVLHDWPDADAERILARAAACLRPGGRLVVFERTPFAVPAGGLAWALIPSLLFLHFYREPEAYRAMFARIGLRDLSAQAVTLEMPFVILSGTKAS